MTVGLLAKATIHILEVLYCMFQVVALPTAVQFRMAWSISAQVRVNELGRGQVT